uniref:TEP-1 C-terminal beta-propeller domain-containing protein n=1 Tax=Leptocylindrus danicus TaxID=163516 RepID=A0A6U2PBM4_9STRA|mmetsp:Transcript_25528/g.38104  ORF Transcript_25528/g.38104 Transcript_25528/m.38104 type:complete len:313 (+) Transcript_25528:85-1023(+)
MSVILATAGYDHKIRFWEAPSGICSRTLRYPDSQVNCLVISPDKQILAAGGNPHIRLFEINTPNSNCILSCEGHTGSVTQLGFQAHGRWMYSSSEDNTVKIWDLRTQHPQRSFDCGSPVNSVCLCPNQMELVSGDANGSVKIWDLGTSKCINSVIPDKAENYRHRCSVPIQNVDVSGAKKHLIAASSRGTVYAWDPTNSSKLVPKAKFQAHSKLQYLLKAKISPDGKTLVTTSSDTTAKLWDTATWECSKILKSHTKWVWDAVFSADSSYLVTASSDFTARLWNLRTGVVVRRYDSDYQMAVTCVALNDCST